MTKTNMPEPVAEFRIDQLGNVREPFFTGETGYSAPISSELLPNSKKTYFFYDDKNFSIDKKDLNAQEFEKIQEAIELMKRMQGIDQFQWIADVATKLEATTFSNPEKIISFQHNEYLQGLEYLGELYQYIKNHKVLKIKYKGFKMDAAIDLILHPYYLKQYNNRWFLFGLNDEYQTIQNLALDRILKIETTNTEWIPSKVNFEEYFEDAQ